MHRLGVKSICYSAAASFSSGIVLLAIGAIAIRRTSAPGEVAYAAIPMIFGVQQLVEGGLWLALPAQTPASHMLAVAYLLFSNVLWPIYAPLAVWMIEPQAARRKLIALSGAAGAATGMFFLFAIITNPISGVIEGPHIDYHLPHPHRLIAFMFYVFGACLAPLLSSHKMVRLFGAAIIVSLIVAYMIYSMWFASVWCFFAALTSGIVLLRFR